MEKSEYVTEPIVKNAMRCTYCDGPVDRYEHIFQCRNCKAIGDLAIGLMSPPYECTQDSTS